jgi:hypothetical protein
MKFWDPFMNFTYPSKWTPALWLVVFKNPTFCTWERTSCFLSQDLPIQAVVVVVVVVVEDVVVVVEDRHQEDVPLEEEVDLDEEAVVLPRRAQEVVVDLVVAVDGLVGEEEAVEGFSYTHTNYIH